MLFRQFEKQVHETWQFLVRFCQQEASPDVLEFPVSSPICDRHNW